MARFTSGEIADAKSPGTPSAIGAARSGDERGQGHRDAAEKHRAQEAGGRPVRPDDLRPVERLGDGLSPERQADGLQKEVAEQHRARKHHNKPSLSREPGRQKEPEDAGGDCHRHGNRGVHDSGDQARSARSRPSNVRQRMKSRY
jgi:hypothetical protein